MAYERLNTVEGLAETIQISTRVHQSTYELEGETFPCNVDWEETYEFPIQKLDEQWLLEEATPEEAEQLLEGWLDGYQQHFTNPKDSSIARQHEIERPLQPQAARMMAYLTLADEYFSMRDARQSEIDSFESVLKEKREEINSAVTTYKTIHPHNQYITAYILDLITPMQIITIDRCKLLFEAYQNYYNDGNRNTHFRLLTPVYAFSHDDIKDIHNVYVNHYNLEGIMIRNINDIYKGGRNNSLIKYKKWTYDEGIIIDVYSADGKEKGCALFKLQYNNDILYCRPEGSFEYRKYWLTNPHTVVGRSYTFKYFSKTNKNKVPRFPIGVAFRNDM